MSTFNTMVSRIADDINRSDIDTQIGLAINRAIAFYANKSRFWFNETTGTFSTVANQLIYTSSVIPTDIAKIDYVQITLSSTNLYQLTPRLYNWVQDMNTGLITGQPTDYAYYSQQFYIYPIPTAIYTITVSYVKKYSTLSGTQTNDFTTYAEDLIEARAEAWIYQRILKDFENATASKAEEKEALQALQTETTRIISTGKTFPTVF